MSPAIIVLAFNRPKALERLLGSLAAAEYHQKAKLIISLEGGATKEVISISRKFECKLLDVEIIEREEKLGLRAHVIACADLSEKYNSVIILEDDLIVDRYFYSYASAALDFYEKDHSVAGIALYSYEYNEFANLPFRSMANGFSTYLMQIPCSWGQCWTASQWKAFKYWYKDKTKADLEKIDRLPHAVKNWPESSWKKYFHGFMIERQKNFIYPYQSYSTNCSDAGGEHIKDGTFIHQVVMATPARSEPKFNFSPSENYEVAYDSFMEPCGDFIQRAIGFTPKEVEIDIHGIKPLSILKSKPYAVTVQKGGTPLCIYSYDFKPTEVNLLFPNLKNHGDFCLLSTSFLTGRADRECSIKRYNYYAGMNLISLGFILNFFCTTAKKIINKFMRNDR